MNTLSRKCDENALVAYRRLSFDVACKFLYASNLQRKIIPLMYQACDLPLWLFTIHYLDVQGNNYAQNFPLYGLQN
jgi:hypothetical protein